MTGVEDGAAVGGDAVRAAAFAKLNLTLHVEGVRPDGYHELEALTVSVGQPHDTVVVSRADPPGVVLALADEPGTVSVPTDASNLAIRAAEGLLSHSGADAGLRVWLRKRIPSGAGLGGGSADAAAVLLAGRALLAACELPGGDLSDADLMTLGATLGADVPFCVAGTGAAWMRGTGEILEPVELAAPLPVVVAVPPMSVSTPAVFGAWDELGGPQATRTLPAPAGLTGFVSELRNDLEPAAEHVAEGLAGFRRHLEEASGLPALLAGSGSGYAVFPDDVRSADRLAERLRGVLDARVFAGATARTGVRVAPYLPC